MSTYKRDDPDFKAKLSKRADELRFKRIIRNYSPTISEQFVHLAEDKELAEIRLEQIKLSPIIAAKPKKTSWLWPIFVILFVSFWSLIFGPSDYLPAYQQKRCRSKVSPNIGPIV